jgi:hypothetical protein
MRFVAIRAVANWRRTKTPSVYVARMRRCPAFENDAARCRCEPSFRGRRRNPVTGRTEWQRPVTKDRSEVLAWLSAGVRNAGRARSRDHRTRSFTSIGDEWLAGVEAGRIGRCKGRGKPYRPTTVADYERCYRNFLRPEFGSLVAEEIGELEWQMWADRLSFRAIGYLRMTSSHERWSEAVDRLVRRFAEEVPAGRRRHPLRARAPASDRRARTHH